MAIDALKADPSRIPGIRRKALATLGNRIKSLLARVKTLVDTEDVFGLEIAPNAILDGSRPIVGNTRWRFLTDTEKIVSFKEWLQEQLQIGLLAPLEGGDPEKPWLSSYLLAAYQSGLGRSFKDVKKPNLNDPLGVVLQSKFIDGLFTATVPTKTLETIYTRSYESLKGFTDDLAARLARTIATEFAKGGNNKKIAKAVRDEIGLTRKRARTIVNTELSYAQSEGQLDGFQELGVTGLKILVEWTTSGSPCPLCASLAGMVVTLKQARGLIPRHPNCRCAWSPVDSDMLESGQKRGRKTIRKMLLRSVKKEHPKSLAPARDSRWAGADLI